MLLLTQIITFIFVFLVVLLNIRSIANNDTIDELIYIQQQTTQSNELNLSKPHIPLHDTSLFNPYNKIKIRQQLNSRLPNINEPLRNLKIGELNFLHTTDTHGWYLGHINQKQYSADWGDLISFHSNLLKNINNHNSDLLLVDSGDRHDGNGLSDLTFPNGELSSKIFKMLDYDLITVGNHELYNEDVSKLEYDNLVSYYGEKFISTNVQYKNDNNDWVVFGNNTHRYFETKINGFKILSFSFLFDFKMANQRVKVTPINEILNQNWFINLVEDYSQNYEIDTIVIFGHIPVDHNWIELYELHSFIRNYFPRTYIQYLGGHSHIRDFSVLDNLSTGLQSGRYCETVGFLSINELPNNENLNNFVEHNIDRKYIDFNLHSFMHHSNHTNLDNFNTEKGLFVSKELAHYARILNLNEVYGKVPHSYYISAADYKNEDEKSLLKFLESEILVQLKSKFCNIKINELPSINNENDRIILINTGGIRYDLYKGEFNKNSLFTVSPFKNMWKVLPSVPTDIAFQIKYILNQGDYIIDNKDLKSPFLRALDQKFLTNKNTNTFNDNPLNITNDKPRFPVSYGYTTADDFGVRGDDTIHKLLHNYYVPNVIQSYEGNTDSKTEFTNVIYYDFIEPFILEALKEACNGDNELYESISSTAQFYNDCSEEFNLGQMLKNYAIQHWN
jgi:2',3'-cyclic-nucleotide 2'-phosphodiesterase (5'-nucleotidase family)